PAYEMALGDLNPPLHAWAVRSVYAREVRQGRAPDYEFLERCFHKLMLNFAWWNNNQRVEPLHLFSGGFLGLDNIGIIDRGAPLEAGRRFLQVDGSSWMAKFALDLMQIALELAKERSTYEELACTFLDQFMLIARDLNGTGAEQPGLWDNEDHFYYD